MKKNGKKKRTISRRILDGWIKVSERRGHMASSNRLEKELGGLSPGKNTKELLEEYYLEKIETGLKTAAAGGVVVFVCVCNVWMNEDLKDGFYIEKEQTGGGKRNIALNAEIGSVTINDLLIEVDEIQLSDDEMKKQLEAIGNALPEKIAGENENLEHVVYPLNLINTWEDTPVSIFWSSSNYGILREDGSFGDDEILQEGMEVILTAMLSYGEIQMEKEYLVKVFPLEKNKEEKLKEELIGLVEVQKQTTKTENNLVLPQMIHQTPIVWKQEKTGSVLVAAGFSIMAVLLILWGKDKDIHEKYEERKQLLLLEYSEFVSKLLLLLTSGMSMRSVFIHLGREYQKARKAGGNRKYVYEELLIVVRKMENGMSEEEAYDYFAKKCDLICYKKLAAIIIQNVKRGTDGLKESLSTETKNAFEERKQTARKLGEEAGTKLLFPMIMMMGIVLIIIVIPAYFSFGGM